MTTTIHSNGSKFYGEAPDTLEQLLAILEKEPLDPCFEAYANFARKTSEAECRVRFWGNFAHLSHVFRIDTDEPDTARRLLVAIRRNQCRKDYRALVQEQRARVVCRTTDEYPTRYAAFKDDGTFLEQTKVETTGGYELAVYYEEMVNMAHPWLVDSISVEICPYAGSGEFLVTASAHPPTDRRSEPCCPGICQRYPTYESARKDAMAWIPKARKAVWEAIEDYLDRLPANGQMEEVAHAPA